MKNLRDKLDRLRRLDPDLTTFGASKHRFELGPALSDEPLAAFEAERKIRLPAEYRAFLHDVGDGGAGPYYGLARLGAEPMPDQFTQVTSTITSKDGSILASAGTGPRPLLARPPDSSRPFPLSAEWAPPSEGDLGLPDDAHPYDGCLYLAEYGCGYFYFLVVTGPAAGQVWFDDTAAVGEGAIRPTGSTFQGWYENWLDDELLTLALHEMKVCVESGTWESDPEILSFVSIAEKNPKAQLDLAIARAYERRFDEAEACAREAERLNPKVWASARLILSTIQLVRGNGPATLETLDRLLQDLEKGTVQGLIQLKRDALAQRRYTLVRLGRIPDAVAAADAAIQWTPFDATGYYEKAFLQLGAGNRDAAVETLRAGTIQIEDQDLALWLRNFAGGCRSRGRMEDASYFERLAVGDPDPVVFPGERISRLSEYVQFLKRTQQGDLMGALSAYGLDMMSYGPVAAAWGQRLAADPTLNTRFVKMLGRP